MSPTACAGAPAATSAAAPRTAPERLRAAGRAFVERRFDDAARDAARALAAEPAPEASAIRAAALLAAGRPGPALATLSRSDGAVPGARWSARLRALAFADLGRARDATAAAEEAVQLAPDDPWAHEALARAHALARRSTEARAAALRAVALAPGDADLRCTLGELYGDGHVAVAEGHLDAAIALDPRNARCWLALGDALERAGRGQEALRARVRAAELDPALAALRRGPSAVVPLLVTGAGIFLMVLAFGLLPAVARKVAPAAAGYATGFALAVVTLLPTAFLVATALLLRQRRGAATADPALQAVVREACAGSGEGDHACLGR